MQKNNSPQDRHEPGIVDLGPIQQTLRLQGAKHADDVANFNDAQIQFILSNRYYAKAALAAMQGGEAAAALICPTGLGGWSLELLYLTDAEAGAVGDEYNAQCDAMGLA